MIKWITFAEWSGVLILLCRGSLRVPGSHGFCHFPAYQDCMGRTKRFVPHLF